MDASKARLAVTRLQNTISKYYLKIFIDQEIIFKSSTLNFFFFGKNVSGK